MKLRFENKIEVRARC